MPWVGIARMSTPQSKTRGKQAACGARQRSVAVQLGRLWGLTQASSAVATDNQANNRIHWGKQRTYRSREIFHQQKGPENPGLPSQRTLHGGSSLQTQAWLLLRREPPPLFVRASAPATHLRPLAGLVSLSSVSAEGQRLFVLYISSPRLTMVDGDDYLQEGFDPRSVTMPRLRSILVTHNVDYPSTAKKPQLVQLVNDHVLSQASKLRADRARAKRSSYGIVNAGSAEDTNAWADHELPPPRSVPRRSRSPRKSTVRSKAADQDVEPPLLSPQKRGSRSASRQLSHAYDEDTASADLARSARRSRRTTTPQIKIESDEDGEEEEPHSPEEERSVFTDDNPFQSGSSPPAAKSPALRRRTAVDDFARAVKTPTRRLEGAPSQRRTSRSFGTDTPRLRSETPEEALDPGEEFTPDEQLELERAAREGEISLAERKPPPPAEIARRTSLKSPLLVLFLALLSAYGAWYRQEKIAVGYCGLGRPAKTVFPPELPVPDALVSLVEPQCEECPPHAYCYQDFSVRCEPDFILEPHPLSLGGFVPFPPSCRPDGEKARRVNAVADKAVEELRQLRAKFECGDLVDETGQPKDSPAITEEELKESVGKKRNKRLSRQEFDELWTAAIGEVVTRDEVESTESENTE